LSANEMMRKNLIVFSSKNAQKTDIHKNQTTQKLPLLFPITFEQLESTLEI